MKRLCRGVDGVEDNYYSKVGGEINNVGNLWFISLENSKKVKID